MVGMKAMKAKVKVAIAEILPESEVSWKKMSKLMKPKTHSGTKIETKLAPGYLYKGILKWTYWNCFIFSSLPLFTGEAFSVTEFCPLLKTSIF